jgi:hypothetical protein
MKYVHGLKLEMYNPPVCMRRVVHAGINTSGWKARVVCMLPLIAELNIFRSFKSIELCEVI